MTKTYQEMYKEKLITPEEAARLIESGDYLLYGGFLGQPHDFDRALAARKEELYDVNIFVGSSILPPLSTATCDPTHEHFTCNSVYFSAVDRKLHDKNLIFYQPLHFSQGQEVFRRHYYPPYTYVGQVAPMDKNGFFSFGPANLYSMEGCLQAGRIILEVNENMPRVPGGSEDSIHISLVDYVIEGSNTPLFELPPPPEPTKEDIAIAKYLMEEIPDRACLQLGIGSLPNLLGEYLADSDLKDLGIHTEIFMDSMVHLFEKGKITNRYKTIDRGKIAFTFALGSNNLYEFMRDNPLMASHPAEYTNDPRNISRNDNVISINNAIEIDLFAQVCSESSGTRQISGTGGQLDFVQGAWYSKGGKSFLCINSTYTDKEGNMHSRIRPTLPNGSIVTTPRTCVDYIVTEYGIAHIKSNPTWRRAELLIELAHPNFRDELIKEAEKMKIWRRSNKR